MVSACTGGETACAACGKTSGTGCSCWAGCSANAGGSACKSVPDVRLETGVRDLVVRECGVRGARGRSP